MRIRVAILAAAMLIAAMLQETQAGEIEDAINKLVQLCREGNQLACREAWELHKKRLLQKSYIDEIERRQKIEQRRKEERQRKEANAPKLVEDFIIAGYCLGYEAVMQEAPENRGRRNWQGYLATLETAERGGIMDAKRRAELYTRGVSDTNACVNAQIKAQQTPTKLFIDLANGACAKIEVCMREAATLSTSLPEIVETGSYVVQVASQRSEADAQAAYMALQQMYPSVLGFYKAVVRRADLGDKGVYYRAQVGPFATAEQAEAMCSSLKAAGGQCVVQRRN